ncbi:hypothetical protein JB92DRAFT_2825033 [Gautieria morchelliformis]|nr:hypothetical protein JB92DRAFT_2825033 [Gautieria morchelliformis]
MYRRRAAVSLWSGHASLGGGGRGVVFLHYAMLVVPPGMNVPRPWAGDGKIIDHPEAELGWQVTCWCPECEEEHGDELHRMSSNTPKDPDKENTNAARRATSSLALIMMNTNAHWHTLLNTLHDYICNLRGSTSPEKRPKAPSPGSGSLDPGANPTPDDGTP